MSEPVRVQLDALVALREELRRVMIRQPITGERNTYVDGFAQGLAYAIEKIDALSHSSSKGDGRE